MTKRFYQKVRIDEKTGCHVWTGAVDEHGYGRYLHHGKNRAAHRIAWRLANGPIPYGIWVLHKCDNPPCVNPAHLFLGTVLDNTRDMISKGRNAPRHGEHGGKTILTEEQARDIKRQPRRIGVQRQLAERYGVAVVTIKAIQYGHNWRHL